MNKILQELAAVIEQRKSASSDSSYVASLHGKGLKKILEKVSEEANETIEAAKECENNSEENKAAVVHETADLWFHTMVMLSHLDLGPEQVLNLLRS